jgi:HEAT repeat protein
MYRYDKDGKIDRTAWAYEYDVDDLISMLKSAVSKENLLAMNAIGIRKIKEALTELETIALYHEDKGIQIEALRTIRKIGGPQALDILKKLNAPEHRDFIRQLLDSSSHDADAIEYE